MLTKRPAVKNEIVLRIKFITCLLLTNIFVGMLFHHLATAKHQAQTPPVPISANHVRVKLPVKSYLEDSWPALKAITITDSKGKVVIPKAIFVAASKDVSPQGLGQMMTIDVPQGQVQRLSTHDKNQFYQAFPYYLWKSPQRDHYEIRI